jgi:hypothetical protein
MAEIGDHFTVFRTSVTFPFTGPREDTFAGILGPSAIGGQ